MTRIKSMPQNLAFSPACERNRQPILQQLMKHVADGCVLLEIGAGTGQHAAYMAPQLPGVQWYPTDTADKLPGIEKWRRQAHCDQIQAAITYKVGQDDWPGIDQAIDVVFTANTFHIMSAELVAVLIQQAGERLVSGARFVVYGPFKYGGEFTSESNRDFDQQLKTTAPHQGIRDFEWVNDVFQQSGFSLIKDVEMPANNRLLAYVKNA